MRACFFGPARYLNNELTYTHTRTYSKRKTSKRMNFPKVFIQPTFGSVFQGKLEQLFGPSRKVIAINNHSLCRREQRFRWQNKTFRVKCGAHVVCLFLFLVFFCKKMIRSRPRQQADNRKFKLHVYGERQTSDSSQESLTIENEHIKTAENYS